jgi:hypothetical protein
LEDADGRDHRARLSDGAQFVDNPRAMRFASAQRCRIGSPEANNHRPRTETETDRQVANRAVWRVTERHANGALMVTGERWGERVFLPATYVAERVELAYATTIADVCRTAPSTAVGRCSTSAPRAASCTWR